jgi:Arm DNA-binding domain
MAINFNTDEDYRAVKPAKKDRLIKDGGGLFLYVKANGDKWWRFIYTLNDKPKKISLGLYPQMSLATARAKAEEARENLANGINPSQMLRAERISKHIILRFQNSQRRTDGDA